MKFVLDGPENAVATVMLAHGAGAPMNSTGMNAIAAALAAVGLRVVRFNFAYMAARQAGEGRKPPPRAERLMPEYIEAIETFNGHAPLFIGGKSMGGRVASMIADDLFDAGKIRGLLCIGYPFHPPARPDQLRTAHLEELRCPTLICQGTRDPFGNKADVATYRLSRRIEIRWFEDGDHDLKPRKKVSGFTAADHMAAMAETVCSWISANS